MSKSAPSKSLQHLLIKPVGAACNLGCGYCFYRRTADQLPPGPPMERAVLEKTIGALLAGRPEVAVFGWQGGEPTLAGLDFFRQVVDIQSRLGARGQRVGNALQTNGVLVDDEWAKFLAEWRFLTGLSLDGPEPVHERWRRGSWRAAISASEKLRKAGAVFNLLVVLTEESAARGGELYRWFLKEGFPDVQFIPCVEPGPGGRPADFSVTAETYGRFLVEAFEEWRANGYPRGASERTFTALLAHFAGEDPGLCTLGAECASYLVVERAGDVYPCDFFVAPEWRLGRVQEASLSEMAASPARARFASFKSAARARCGDCPWWDLCHGGCPKDRLAAGDISAPTPLCAAYRKLFEVSAEWFRAEGAKLAERCRRQREVAAIAGRQPAVGGPALRSSLRRAKQSRRKQETPPPSRNDPCPCGSGKKFKRCCGK